MFTGIVQGLCPLVAVQTEANLCRLTVQLGDLAIHVRTGASVAINGVCLTVTGDRDGNLSFDVIRETLDQTNLGTLNAGDLVNVERSFRVGDEVGGHILSGHVVDTVGVEQISTADNLREIRFSVDDAWMKFLHHKGFVALDGASLTIAAVNPVRNEISVSLIPETIERTTLGLIRKGDRVNLEIDAQTQAVVNTVERLLHTPELLERLTRSTEAGK